MGNLLGSIVFTIAYIAMIVIACMHENIHDKNNAMLWAMIFLIFSFMFEWRDRNKNG
jgi:Ca2+/Na+ antiporter